MRTYRSFVEELTHYTESIDFNDMEILKDIPCYYYDVFLHFIRIGGTIYGAYLAVGQVKILELETHLTKDEILTILPRFSNIINYIISK